MALTAFPTDVGKNTVDLEKVVKWAFGKKTSLKPESSVFGQGGKRLPELALAAKADLVAQLARVSKSKVTNTLATKGKGGNTHHNLSSQEKHHGLNWTLFALASVGKGRKVQGLVGVVAGGDSEEDSSEDESEGSESDVESASDSPSPSPSSGSDCNRLENRKRKKKSQLPKGKKKQAGKGQKGGRKKSEMAAMQAKLARAAAKGDFQEVVRLGAMLAHQQSSGDPFSVSPPVPLEVSSTEGEEDRVPHRKGAAKKRKHKKRSRSRKAKSDESDESSSSDSGSEGELREREEADQRRQRGEWLRAGVANKSGAVSLGKVSMVASMRADEKCTRAIAHGKFNVDFASMLVGKKAFSNKGRCQLSRASWVEAWKMFAKVVESSFKVPQSELSQYQCQIEEWFWAYRESHPQGAILYDEQFREKATAVYGLGGIANFAEVDPSLFNQVFGGRAAATCVGCGSSSHSNRNCNAARGGKKEEKARPAAGGGVGTKQEEASKGVCFPFQKAKGCQREDCKFKHACSKCAGPKGKFECQTCKP
jgi:hypothetical protein